MNDFMIHVERIVRPIRAMDDRKDRMREELLAHLETSFEQERARHADEGFARQRAIVGLGDPTQLRNDLQDSVSPSAQFKARIEKVFSWHAPEPAWRYTLRAGVWTGALLLLLLPFAVIALLASGEEGVYVGLRLIALMGFLTGINVFVVGLLYFKIRDNLLGAFGTKRSWPQIAMYVVASAAMVEGSLLFFLWANTGEIGDDLSLLLGRSLIAFALPSTGIIVALIRGPAELRHAEWECLDIREGPPTCVVSE